MKEKCLPPNPCQRALVLESRRQLKMARSAHAYVRGSTLKFYEWLMTPSAASLPQGPPVWICGDCHLGNLGPIASKDGEVELEIRDLDQAVVANPAHDLVRLGLATAARSSDLPGVTTARIIEQLVKGYQDALKRPSGKPKPDAKAPAPIQMILKNALRRRWKHLAEERIEDARPQIPLGERFWALSKNEKLEIRALFDTEPVRKLVTSLQMRDDDARIEVVDAA